MTNHSTETSSNNVGGTGDEDLDEHAKIGPKTRWFWDPLGCQHVSRYLLARSRVVGTNVVDVACGSGYGSALLARDPRLRVTGIDVSPDAIRAATSGWSRSNLLYEIGDALHLGMAPGCADTVVPFETIEHVVDPARFLDQIALLLRPGGRLIVSTPDRSCYSPRRRTGSIAQPVPRVGDDSVGALGPRGLAV